MPRSKRIATAQVKPCTCLWNCIIVERPTLRNGLGEANVSGSEPFELHASVLHCNSLMATPLDVRSPAQLHKAPAARILVTTLQMLRTRASRYHMHVQHLGATLTKDQVLVLWPSKQKQRNSKRRRQTLSVRVATAQLGQEGDDSSRNSQRWSRDVRSSQQALRLGSTTLQAVREVKLVRRRRSDCRSRTSHGHGNAVCKVWSVCSQ